MKQKMTWRTKNEIELLLAWIKIYFNAATVRVLSIQFDEEEKQRKLKKEKQKSSEWCVIVCFVDNYYTTQTIKFVPMTLFIKMRITREK